jgi:hypothetical protein
MRLARQFGTTGFLGIPSSCFVCLPGVKHSRLVLTATEEKIAWDVAERQFRFDGHKAKPGRSGSIHTCQRANRFVGHPRIGPASGQA